jgi:hypothetical protein
MVDGEVQRSADELRDTAAKLRLLAQQTRSAEARRALIGLAERFEGTARQIDGSGPDAVNPDQP